MQKTVEIPVVVGNVPVTMQRQFQQSSWYMSEVRQIQFIDRVLFPVAHQRRAFTVQTVQKTANIPQVGVAVETAMVVKAFFFAAELSSDPQWSFFSPR